MDCPLARCKFSTPVISETVLKDWTERGYDCQSFVDPPDQEWNNFVHGTNELVTVIEGQLEIKIGSQRHLLNPGDEIFIPKGAIHSVRNSYHDTTHWVFGYD